MDCYACKASATGACSRCGSFYCARHGGEDREKFRAICAACFDRMRPTITFSGVVLVVLSLLPFGFGFAGLRQGADGVGAGIVMLLLGLVCGGVGVWRLFRSQSQFPPGTK